MGFTRNTGDDPADLLGGRYTHAKLVAVNGSGPSLTSEDGEEYIDFVLGNLTQILGHGGLSPNEVWGLMGQRSLNVGDQPHPGLKRLAGQLAEISHKQSIRFTNSGSEAMHLAIRLARAVTGRSYILKFHGHYHGWFSEEIASFLPGAASIGLPPGVSHWTIAVDWNDKEAVSEAFDRYGSQISAVVCEPCLAHAGTVPPFDGFLELIRRLSTEYGAALIFDECITGFRQALGGAQEFYGVQADIVTYSKALAAGLPIGVVAATEKFMEPGKRGEVFHASTYDGNPFAIEMACALLKKLNDGRVLKQIERNTAYLLNGLKNIMELCGERVLLQSAGSFFGIYFTSRTRISSLAEANATDWKKYQAFVNCLHSEKVIVSEGELWSQDESRRWIGSWFLSAAHIPRVLDTVIDRAHRAIRIVQEKYS